MTTKAPLLLFLLFLPVRSITAFSCPLTCENGGTCQVLAGGSGSHRCDCPPGFTGTLCEVAYTSCGVPPTSSPCQNGGVCELGEVDDFGNAQRYCNCAKGMLDLENMPLFRGKYCQHEVISIESAISHDENQLACSDETQATFCLNDGKCNPDYPDFGDACLCKPGYFGNRCEDAEVGNVSEVAPVAAPTPASTGNGMSWASNEWPTTQTTTPCKTACQNQGVCRQGTPPASLVFHVPILENEWCECPESFGGPDCSIPRVPCGTSHSCYFGSSCAVSGTAEGRLHCDCSTANKPVAGRFCHLPATSPCGPTAFCVNGGTCRTDAHEGCACPDGFTGFACEFSTNDIVTDPTATPMDGTKDHAAVTKCDLPCKNGGSCRHEGSYHASSTGDKLAGFFLAEHQYSDSNAMGQHCVCPPGFAGAYCEFEMDPEDKIECGQGRHLCPNDSSTRCVAYGEEMLCECGLSSGQLASFFEASYCEHPVHDICTVGAILQKSVLPGGSLSYCTNGGRCKKAVKRNEGHAGCTCPPGYLGPHCEIPEGTSIARVANTSPYTSFKAMHGRKSSRGTTISLLLLSVASVAAIALLVRRRRRQRHQQHVNQSLFWAGGYRDSTEDQDAVNIAPKRRSVMETSSSSVYDSAIRSSSRPVVQPPPRNVTTHREDDDDDDDDEGVEMTDTSTSDEDDGDVPPEPKLYMGPPRDEDGHELHNVEIV